MALFPYISSTTHETCKFHKNIGLSNEETHLKTFIFHPYLSTINLK